MTTRVHPCTTLVCSAGIAAALLTPERRQPSSVPASASAEQTGCTEEERRDALREMQSAVLNAAPDQVASMEQALQKDGALAGWRLSHGYVVMATAGAIAVDNVRPGESDAASQDDSADPLPPLLLYEPSPSSTPPDWLDYNRADNPYRLVGWAYASPYSAGSQPPARRCIAPSEWLIHEAGWHLKDGGMRLTPGAVTEPARPDGLAIHMWHPPVWDLHVWRGDNGVPAVAYANPTARAGGRELPDAAFFYLVNGKKQPLHTRH